MTTESPVLRERRPDGIEILRLNRPEKRNALDSASLALITAALEELSADEELRVLVISTTNPRALCAGADIGPDRRRYRIGRQDRHQGGAVRCARSRCPGARPPVGQKL